MSLPNSQFGGMGTQELVTPSCNWTSLGGLGTGSATTTLATGVFLHRVCEEAMLFLTTTTAFLLPCLNSVYVFCTVRPCGKEPSSGLQSLYHDVDMFSSIGPSCLHQHHAGGEGLYGLHILGEHYLVIAIWVRFFCNAVTYLHSCHSTY